MRGVAAKKSVTRTRFMGRANVSVRACGVLRSGARDTMSKYCCSEARVRDWILRERRSKKLRVWYVKRSITATPICAKPNQAKPSQAKPSQAHNKPSRNRGQSVRCVCFVCCHCRVLHRAACCGNTQWSPTRVSTYLSVCVVCVGVLSHQAAANGQDVRGGDMGSK